MKENETTPTLTRRQLLASSAALGTLFVIGSTFVASPTASWALSVTHLKPETMATLIQLARDIYPHDKIGDEYYAIAVKGYDTAEAKENVEAGVAILNGIAIAKGHKSYLDVGWERDRVDILRSIEDSPFFQTLRGGLVTGLYNQKAIWPTFGYEGESYSKGGYINNGFDDINWI